MGNKTYQQNYSLKVKYGGFSKEEIDNYKNYFNNFLSGSDQFMCKKLLMKQLKLQNTQDADKIYNFFDLDLSNSVDSYKFICGMTLLRQSTLIQKAKKFFDIFNSDNSNLLDKSEIQNFLNSIDVMLQDLNIQQQKNLCQNVNKYDLNNDGYLNQQEFIQFFTNEPEITQYLKVLGILTSEDLKITDFAVKFDDEDLQQEFELHNRVADKRASQIRNGVEIPSNIDFLSEQPWRAYLQKQIPDNFDPKSIKLDIPDMNLEIQHVNGYMCDSVRNQVKYDSEGQIIYFIATICVILNQEQNCQYFYHGHSDQVICIDVQGITVISGQFGIKPRICLWSSQTRQTIFNIQSHFDNGIQNITFSPCGKYFVASSLTDNQLAVYDINTLIEAQTSVNPLKPLPLALSNQSINHIIHLIFISDSLIVTCCQQELISYSIDHRFGLLQSQVDQFFSFYKKQLQNIMVLLQKISLIAKNLQKCLKNQILLQYYLYQIISN